MQLLKSGNSVMVQMMSDAVISEREHLFIDALHEMEVPGAPGTDPYLNAYAAAMGSFVVHGEYKTTIDGILERNINASYRAHLVARAIAKQAMPWRPEHLKIWYPRFADVIDAPRLGDEVDFPRNGFECPEAWEAAIERIMSNPTRQTEFFADLRWRHMATNVAPRYKGVKLASQRFEEPRILDIACSQNNGLKQLALVQSLPFDKLRVGGFAADDDMFVEHPELSAKFNEAINRPQPLGPSLGIDFFPLSDIENHFWARACFRPSELLDQAFMAHFDTLSAASPPNVNFARGDAAVERPEFMELHPPEGQFNVVSMLTFMYLLKKQEQQQVLEHAERYIAADGVVVWQDFFIDTDPQNPITPENIYQKGSVYYTLVKDMREPERGFQELIKWNRGRGEEAQVDLDTYDRISAS